MRSGHPRPCQELLDRRQRGISIRAMQLEVRAQAEQVERGQHRETRAAARDRFSTQRGAEVHLDRVAILAARDRPEVPRERLLNGRIPGGSAAIVHGAQRSGPRAPT